jgi:hypothetical protein
MNSLTQVCSDELIERGDSSDFFDESMCHSVSCQNRVRRLQSVIDKQQAEFLKLKKKSENYVLQTSNIFLLQAISQRSDQNTTFDLPEYSDDDNVSLTMTMEGGDLATPRVDMINDILETPRGKAEWNEYKESTERYSLREKNSQLENELFQLSAKSESQIAKLGKQVCNCNYYF